MDRDTATVLEIDAEEDDVDVFVDDKRSVSESEYKKYVRDADVEDYLRGRYLILIYVCMFICVSICILLHIIAFMNIYMCINIYIHVYICICMSIGILWVIQMYQDGVCPDYSYSFSGICLLLLFLALFLLMGHSQWHYS
jgi:hypothetical protein